MNAQQRITIETLRKHALSIASLAQNALDVGAKVHDPDAAFLDLLDFFDTDLAAMRKALAHVLRRCSEGDGSRGGT
mgnify:FL=1